MSLTGLAFLGGYALALLRSLGGYPLWGMYAYLGAFYLDPSRRWWGGGLPSVRWSLVAAMVTLLCLMMHGDKRDPRPSWLAHPIPLVMLLYVLYLYGQIPFVISSYHTEGVVLFSKYLVLYYIMYKLINSEQMLRMFMAAHVTGCTYFGYLAFSYGGGGRVEGIGGPGVTDSNTLGMHLSTGVLIASFMLLSEKRWVIRALLVVALAFMVNGVILTQSRGALAGLVAGGMVTVLLKPPAIRKVYWVLSVVAVLGFLSLAGNALFDRVQQLMGGETGEEQVDGSARSRVVIAKAQLEMFEDYPLGVGFRGTTYLSRQYLDVRWLTGPHPRELYGSRASHNTLLSQLVNGGPVALLLYLAVPFICFFILRNLRSLDGAGLPVNLGLYRAGIGAALTAAFVAGQAADYTKAEVQIWLLVCMVALSHMCYQAVQGTAAAQQDAGARKRPGRFRVA